jgi:quinol monooxygenase YgiN
MNQVTVFATLKSKEDTIVQTKALLTNLIGPTKKEQGCIVYELHQNSENPTNFYFYEIWENRASLDAHLNSPHVKNLLDCQKEFLSSEIQVGFAEKILC